MAGTVVADVFQSSITGTPPQFNDGTSTQIGTLCRAFVNFNGTGAIAIRASFNVTSITDNGTGDYTVNFTNALPDANYAVSGMLGGTAGMVSLISADQATARTASLFRLYTLNGSGGFGDPAQVNVSVFR